jgi:hypothetical protein
MRNAGIAGWVVVGLLVAGFNSAPAQSLSAWTCAAGTTRLTNSGACLHACAGQGQPLDPAGTNGIALFPGFLGGALLATNLDHDADGLADETDPDNDNDGLDDLTELAGTAFPVATVTDVNSPDSDGDGATDSAEAAMRSNPLNATSRLAITALTVNGPVTVVRWRAQGGKSYHLQWGPNLGISPPTNDLGGPVTATGGSAPWFDTFASNTVSLPAYTSALLRVVAP